MNNLINALNEFKAIYKGDPAGLKSDFTLIAGHTIQELTDLLMDEVNANKALDEEGN